MDSALLSEAPAASHSPTPVLSPSDYAALETYLSPIRKHLGGEITELCINRPGEFWTESRTGWERHEDPALTYEWASFMAKLVANATKQRLTQEYPVLSAALPTGERVQLVVSPATSSGTVSMTIRKPTKLRYTMEQYEESGFFRYVRKASADLAPHELQLQQHLEKRELQAFFRLAVASHQNIIVSGATGSGKTTFMKALADLIPSGERIITIEDTPELELREQPNHVRLFYSKDGQGVSKTTPKILLESCLRMKPDRILLAEIRGEEAFYYVRNVNSGHPGSITSIHASNELMVFDQLMLMIKESPAGAQIAREDIKQLLFALVDIVVQVGRVDGERAITGIYYEPIRKRALVG